MKKPTWKASLEKVAVLGGRRPTWPVEPLSLQVRRPHIDASTTLAVWFVAKSAIGRLCIVM